MSKKLILTFSFAAALIIVVLLLVGQLALSPFSPLAPNKVQSFQGTAVCLPDSTAPSDCILGIKEANGKMYQLEDMALRYPEEERENLIGKEIIVRGKLMPPPAPAGNLEGIIQVEEIPQAEEILSIPDQGDQPETGVSSGGSVETGPGISIDQSATGLHTVPDLQLNGGVPAGSLTVKYVIEHRSALSQNRMIVTVKGVVVAVQLAPDTLCPQKGSGILAPCVVTSRIVLADSASPSRDLNYDLVLPILTLSKPTMPRAMFPPRAIPPP